jgi:hypothetical protein
MISYASNINEDGIQWYKTSSLAIKVVNKPWTAWEKCVVNIKFDLNKDKIVIYSNDPQIYTILEEVEPPYDSGGRQIKFRVIDQDRDYGYIRLRIENNGNSQIYVDFSDVTWVYNVRRIYY